MTFKHIKKPNGKFFSKIKTLRELMKGKYKKNDKINKPFITKNNITITDKINNCSLFNNNSIIKEDYNPKTDRNYQSIFNNKGFFNNKEFYRNPKTLKKNNFSNLSNLISNISSNNIMNSSSIKNSSNLLKNCLTKKNTQDNIVTNSLSLNSEITEYPKRKISKINNQTLILNNEQLNKIHFKNLMNLDKSDKNKNLIMNQRRIETFCYYKILEKNSKLFNPLNNRLSINKLGYNEGFISIDPIKDCFKIKTKCTFNKSNNKCIKYLNITDNNTKNSNNSLNHSKSINLKNSNNIELKDIKAIYIDKVMKNIIKIHNVFLKYSKKNDKNKNNINKKNRENAININKILNEKEIIKIQDMEQSEKIKAGLCNFFSFIIELNSSKIIEFVLINFCNFKTWFNYLNYIVKNNNRTIRTNSSVSCFLNDKNSYKNRLKYVNIILKNKKKEIQRSTTNNIKCKINFKGD
jgi:hypothetical protein